MVTRHEFLAMLHEHLKPRGYLEIGVHTGASLQLVRRGTPAIGIDPAPVVLHGHLPGTTQVYQITSDDFFADPELMIEHDFPLDLIFIDGMHLFEYALRDFMNVERLSNPHTVVVFDDVLPRNQHEAAREMCPGDWTGDVWKVPRLLHLMRRDLQVLLVDTFPTGTAVVFQLDPTSTRLHEIYDQMIDWGLDQWETVPEEILSREGAVAPEDALEQVTSYLLTVEG